MNKLSFSNLAWNNDDEQNILANLKDNRFSAIEIAPTKTFGINPFDNKNQFKKYRNIIKKNYDLDICSFQSIWYGVNGSLTNSQDRLFFTDYTKKIIDCASAISCHNIVFGNPSIRKGSKTDDLDIQDFFYKIGNYAYSKNTKIALEANPTIYNTDFINTTKEAISYCKQIDSKGLKVNLDLGTMIYNKESWKEITEEIDCINHIHISEPFLEVIKKRDLHNNIKKLEYDGYVSVEMSEAPITCIIKVAEYISHIINDS